MTSRDFCFWLQGYFELSGDQAIDQGQSNVIKQHLSMVFRHEIDPQMGNQAHQTDLDTIHAGAIGGGTLSRPLSAQ